MSFAPDAASKHKERGEHGKRDTLIWYSLSHADQHPLLCRVPSILSDGDDIGPLLGHVDKVPTTPVRELNGIHQPSLQSDKTSLRQLTLSSIHLKYTKEIVTRSHRSNNVRHMRHGCSKGSSEVQHTCSRSLKQEPESQLLQQLF